MKMGCKKYNIMYMFLAGIICLTACAEADISRNKLVGYGVVQYYPQWNGVQPSDLDVYYYKVGDNLIPDPRHLSVGNLRDTLPVGRYRALVIKPVATGVSFGNLEKYEWGKIIAETYRGNGSVDAGRLLATPSDIFAVAVNDLNITEDQTVEINLVSPPRVQTVGLTFTFTTGAEDIRSISGVLYGTVSEIYIATNHTADGIGSAGTTGMPFQLDVTGNTVTTTIDLLGLYNPDDGKNYDCKVHLKILDAEGSTHELEADLNQFATAVLKEYGMKLPTGYTAAAEIEITRNGSEWITTTKEWDREGTIGEII